MAFVPVATTTATGLTALTSYFIPLDTTAYSSEPYSIVNLISGTEYYVEGNQYTSNNVLKIDNASAKLNKVRWILGSNAIAADYLPWATNTGNAKTIDFSIFPRLSSVSFEGNSPLATMDLRGLPMKNIAFWGAGSLTALHITNILFYNGSQTGSGTYGNIDVRQSQLSSVNVSGCNILSLNLSDNQLSSFEFKLGNPTSNSRIYKIAAGRNAFKNNTVDLTSCDERLLSGVEELKFSRWNNYSNGTPLGNGDPARYKLKSITIAGPLSSLYSLDVAQNSLSSLNVPYIPNLKNLFIGQKGRWFESSNDEVQRTLSANNITFNSLTALQYLNMGGIGPISGLDQITGMNRLSSLAWLDASNNDTLQYQQGKTLRDFDLSILPDDKLQWLELNNNYSLTAINFGKQTFTQRSIPNNAYIPEYISPTLSIAGCNALSTLNLSALSGLFDLYAPYVPQLRTLIMPPATANSLAAITITDANYLTDLKIPHDLSYLVFIANCNALTGLVLDYNYKANNIHIENVPSNLQFAGCSALQYLYLSNINNTEINFARDLSACKTITCNNNPYLNSVNFSPGFNSLDTLTFNQNSLVQTVDIQNFINLKSVNINGNYASTVNIKNNFNLYNIVFYDTASNLLPYLDCSNNFNLREFTYTSDNIYYSESSYLSGFDFTNCYKLSAITIQGANLRTFDSLKYLNNLKYLNTDGLPLTSLDALNYVPSLTSLAMVNSYGVSGPSMLVNLDSYYNPVGIQSVLINYYYTLTSADTLIKKLTQKCSYLNLYQNYLKTLNTASFSALNLNYINIGYNRLGSKEIDSLLIALDKNPVTPAGDKTVWYQANLEDRSRVSNAATNSLVAKGWSGTYSTSYRARPDFYITSVPETLQISKTADILSTASYLGSSVPTYVTVLSGPGVITGNGNTLSAFESSGVITVAISSADTFYYYPLSTVRHIQAIKYDVSPYIVFSGLNKTYTSNVIEASASVLNYPLTAALYYYQNGVSAIPLEAGYYTVSAVVSGNDYYGTATDILSVLNAEDFYTLPVTATSSAIYFPKTVDAEKDVVITFDYAFYGPGLSGSEGFCVSFTDATAFSTIISGGGPGKALNYTNLTLLSANNDTFVLNNYPGKFKGSLGIGFDATGNFALTSIGVPGMPDALPNSITIRDSQSNNYNVLYRTEALTFSSFKSPIKLYEQTTQTPTFKTVRVRLTGLGKKILVDMKPVSAQEFVNYVDYELPVAQPSIASVALSYSSGQTSSIFKIKNFNINCFFKAASALLSDLFNASLTGSGTIGTNGITYTSPYNIQLYYQIKPLTDLPYTMNLYIEELPVANVLFDPVYLGDLFAALAQSKTFYSYFISGANYLV